MYKTFVWVVVIRGENPLVASECVDTQITEGNLGQSRIFLWHLEVTSITTL